MVLIFFFYVRPRVGRYFKSKTCSFIWRQAGLEGSIRRLSSKSLKRRFSGPEARQVRRAIVSGSSGASESLKNSCQPSTITDSQNQIDLASHNRRKFSRAQDRGQLPAETKVSDCQ